MFNEKTKNKRKATKGETVIFYRHGMTIIGRVLAVREKTVIVELTQDVVKVLELANNLTVVAHKNYRVKESV